MVLLPSHVRLPNRGQGDRIETTRRGWPPPFPSTRLAEHPNPRQCGGFRADLADEDAALSCAFDGGDGGVTRPDQLVPPRAGEVPGQFRGAEREVIAASGKHLAGEPPPHAVLVAGASGVQ